MIVSVLLQKLGKVISTRLRERVARVPVKNWLQKGALKSFARWR